jgi:glycosyltransferase involved in cell wall biosynthesis
MDNISVKAHTSFIGQTGYNAHARDFFTALSKIVKLRIRNFTVGKTWNGLGEKIDGKFDPHKNEEYLSEYQRNLIGIQTLYCDPNAVGRYGSNLIDYEVYDGYNIFDDNDKIIDIILNTTNHQYFFNLDKYNGFKIAYNVWESTRYNDDFFDILKKYDQFWCPSKWQRDCIVEQGYPEDKVFIVPEAIDEKIFHPAYFNPNIDNYTDNRFKFILFGRWEFRKSTTEIIQTFLKTFDANDPVDLIISVDNTFSDDNLKSTEERLSHYNLNDSRIKIIHFPKREDYINYLKNGHVFLSCSRSEGWNLPLCLPNGKLIFSNNKFKNIEDVKKDDYVITHTSKNKKVLNTFKKYYSGNLNEILLYGDIETLELTPEHPVYCIKRDRFITKKNRFKILPKLEPEWIKSKNVNMGDIVIRTTISQYYYENINFDLLKLDDNLLYDDNQIWYKTGYSCYGKLIKYNRYINIWDLSFLFGWYIAEGTDGNSKVIFTLNAKTEIHIAEKIILDMKKHFGAIGSYTIIHNTLRVVFNSSILCKFFTYFCDKLAWNKKIPEKILLGDLKILKNLVDNMVLGDGYFNVEKNLTSYTTTSYILARQLIIANQRLGIKTNIQLEKRKNTKKTKNRRLCYTLNWTTNNKNFRHSNKSWWHPCGLAILVKNNKIKKYNGYVYNLEVDNDNSYLMANATVHNCEAMACGTPSIYSNCSGQLEFAEGKGHPVKIEKEIPFDAGNYYEPDFNDLSLVMKDVYINYWKYKEKALKDSDDIRNKFTWENAANKAYEILRDIK